MSNFSFLATPSSLTYTSLDGKTNTITDSHVNFEKAKATIKEIQTYIRADKEDSAECEALFDILDNLIAPVKKITASGQITIVDGVLYFEGKELHNAVTERILWGMSEGFEMKPYIAFLENLMQNVSYRSIQQLFTFMEKHKMGITDDGHILGYKRVTNDYKDCHSRTIDNSPGAYVTMTRNQVSDDPGSLCSAGLHFCSMEYLPSFGTASGNRIVIVKVNPKDVVSIPNDHNAAKARCCAYLVLSEYEGDDKEDILSHKAVFTTGEFTGNYLQDDGDGLGVDDEWSDSENEDGQESEWSESWQDSESSEEYQNDDLVADGDGVVSNKDWASILNNLEPVVVPEANLQQSAPIVEEVIEAKAPVQPDLFDSAQNISDLLKNI